MGMPFFFFGVVGLALSLLSAAQSASSLLVSGKRAYLRHKRIPGLHLQAKIRSRKRADFCLDYSLFLIHHSLFIIH